MRPQNRTHKRKPRPKPRLFSGGGRSSEDADRRGLRALLALLDFELDALVLGQRLEARALDLAEVREQVLAARVGGDEAEALAVVEPLDDASLGAHGCFLKFWGRE